MIDHFLIMMPHGACYLWNPFLVWLHVLSDATVFGAYLAIPSLLLKLTLHRKGEEVIIVRWFIAFIVLCGLTHFLEIVSVWNPIYYLSGYVKALTGAVSMVTVVKLGRLLLTAMNAVDRMNEAHDYQLARDVLWRIRKQAG